MPPMILFHPRIIHCDDLKGLDKRFVYLDYLSELSCLHLREAQSYGNYRCYLDAWHEKRDE